MSPEEIELLQQAGQVLIFNIAIVVTESVLYGLYLAIFAFGIRALLKRSPWTQYTWTLFGFLSILFLISTANLATLVASTIRLIHGALVNNADQPLIDRLQLADAGAEGMNIAETWLGGAGGGGFLFIFADAVVVWRAYVLWPGNKIAKVLPVALLFASLGIFLYLQVPLTATYLECLIGSAIASAALDTISFAESRVVPTSSPTGITITLSQSLSIATNVVATMFIGYKAYHHRQMMKTSMGGQSSTSGAILLFLTESGVAFCVLQIIATATSASDNKPFTTLDYAAHVWAELTLFAAVSYPVLVLIIVDNHRSIADHTGSAADSGAAHGSNSLGVGSHLSFAAAQPGISSSGGEVGTDTLTGSRIDAAFGSAVPVCRLHVAEGRNSEQWTMGCGFQCSTLYFV